MNGCPNLDCSFYLKTDLIVKSGLFFRSNDSRWVQRFKCQHCKRRFCSSTGTLEMNQKKRRVNYPIFKFLASGVSMRRIAFLLNVDRKTVHRKLIYLGQKCRRQNQRYLASRKNDPVTHLQFDDLITKENSKLKPLAVSLAVDARRNLILGAEVSQIPAFGHLAVMARKKYGARKCHHREGLTKLFQEIKVAVSSHALICTDEHQNYPTFVQKYFPKASHQRFKSERGCVAGQGELKRVKFDPLFKVNHSCAMLRANMNRLIRKTWCTTKDPVRLKDHLDIFINFLNFKLRAQKVGLAPVLSAS